MDDRLVRVTFDQGIPATEQTIEYGYNHQGDRTRREVTGHGAAPEDLDRLYLTDRQNLTGYCQALAEVDGQSGDTLRNYVYGSDYAPLAQSGAAGASDFFHADHLGTTRALTTSSGSASDVQQYEPYGTPSNGALSSLTSKYFTAQDRDVYTNLQYHRARWLDTTQGRWYSQDPVFDFPGNFGNGYGYVGGEPNMTLDLRGSVSLSELSTTEMVASILVGMAAFNATLYCVGEYVGEFGTGRSGWWIESTSGMWIDLGALSVGWGIVNDFGPGLITQQFFGLKFSLLSVLELVVGLLAGGVLSLIDSALPEGPWTDTATTALAGLMGISTAYILYFKELPAWLWELYLVYRHLLSATARVILERVGKIGFMRAVNYYLAKVFKKTMEDTAITRRRPSVETYAEISVFPNTVGSDLMDGMLSIGGSYGLPGGKVAGFSWAIMQGFDTLPFFLNSATGGSLGLSISTPKGNFDDAFEITVDRRFN